MKNSLSYHAISDQTRRQILDLLSQESLTAGAIALRFGHISRPAVSKHLAVLRRSKLVLIRKQGRERIYTLNAAPLKDVSDWVGRYQAFWDEHYLREQIARPLLEGVKPPEDVTFIPPPPFYGSQKDVIAFWFDRARTMTRRMLESWPEDGNTDLTHVGGLEAMGSLGWLEGYGGHEAFHHQQIDKVIAQLKEYDVK